VIKVFPNPSEGNFTVKFYNNPGHTEITVMNILNKSVYSCELEATKGKTLNIDLGGIVEGVYFMRIRSGSHEIIEKLMIY
jgi:hypothetical protein